MAVIASSFVGTVVAAILAQTTLAFVGVTPISNWNWGTILFWAQSNNAFPDKWWWYLPAGLCIALVGMALALVNFGIDEYVNPRLRSAGQRARALQEEGLLDVGWRHHRRSARRPQSATEPGGIPAPASDAR